MRSLAIVPLFGLMPLLFAGCEPPAVNVPSATPPPPPSAETHTGDLAPAAETTNNVEPFAERRSIQPREQDSPQSAPSEPPIHLSAGVALPQLLPEGTQIGVSVDYKVNGNLKSSRYFLVMESSAGAIAVPVELSPRGGTLQGYFPPSVRPEHQPFRVRIDESPTSNAVHASNTLPLKTSY